MHCMQGEIVLRDGVYLTEDDAVLQLAGVYVVATGRIHAVAQPVSPALRLGLEPSDIEQNSVGYRCAA